ncbi:hypothetical protein FH972_026554 [Carpinus fangiana]|uniref:BHLH domain-containing protein n=1 Tax=Carpinus fangiana TaxID=176857 RepID=A0A5N6L5A5_9ROSI|nr:hypothetical protein FH972_026554 [Carpinus fangiana]
MSSASPSAGGIEKPRLSEQEKKSNHIASEQKRRQAIREGFDEIADIVPGYKGQGRSEAIVLQGSTAYLRSLLAERHRLVQQARERGIDTSPFELDDQTMKIAAAHAANEENKSKPRR